MASHLEWRRPRSGCKCRRGPQQLAGPRVLGHVDLRFAFPKEFPFLVEPSRTFSRRCRAVVTLMREFPKRPHQLETTGTDS